MDTQNLICRSTSNCNWFGPSDHLVSSDEKPNRYTHCPDCGGEEFEEEEEIEDEAE